MPDYKNKIKLSKFDREELTHKIEVLIDSGAEMWESIKFTEEELETLKTKINDPNKVVEFSDKELALLREEAEDLLTTARTNLSGGFTEYQYDVTRLRLLMKKLSR